MGLVPLGPLYAGPSFLEVPVGLGLLLCILGPPLGASGVGPLPPRPGGGGIGRPDLDLGAGGGGIGFPEGEIAFDLGFTCPVFSLSGFSFDFFSCSRTVVARSESSLVDAFFELTTGGLATSPWVSGVGGFVLLGGGFLELTGLETEADSPSLLVLPSLSEALFDLLVSLAFLVAIPSDTAFLRTRSACASTRLEEWLLASIPKDSHNAIISLFVTSNSLASS